jgi:hypothetical protein
MPLQKARLTNTDPLYINKPDDAHHIQFMFNPNMISFSRSISIEPSRGARNHRGDNQTSFKHPNPYTVQIGNIMIDTYESRTSVLEEIKKFRDGVQFVNADNSSGQAGNHQRPPIYLLQWGETNYLRCFIKTLNFKLTLFLNDGTPVRATVDLTLEQVAAPNVRSGQSANNPSGTMRAGGRPNLISD